MVVIAYVIVVSLSLTHYIVERLKPYVIRSIYSFVKATTLLNVLLVSCFHTVLAFPQLRTHIPAIKQISRILKRLFIVHQVINMSFKWMTERHIIAHFCT